MEEMDYHNMSLSNTQSMPGLLQAENNMGSCWVNIWRNWPAAFKTEN